MAEHDEDVRVRSEGALELARSTEHDLRLLAMGLNSERWRAYLPELEAMVPKIPALRAARDRLDVLRERENWPADSSPMRALLGLEHALYTLDASVQLQLQNEGINHGAPLLEDAAAQLIARAHATAAPEPPITDVFDNFRVRFGLVFVLSVATLFTIRLNPILSLFGLALLLPSTFSLASERCPRCTRRFLLHRLVRPLVENRCGYCGYRGQ